MKKINEQESFFRSMTLERDSVDDEARTVKAALSSEQPVKRWFGNEVLVHKKDAVNLERAGEGLPLLWGHNHDQPIGLIEGIKLDKDKKLRGLLRFSNNAKASEIWPDVRDGFLKDISVGYRIDQYEEKDNGERVDVTRWTPLEASVVAVPADHSVGINRNLEVNQMTEEVKDKTAESGEPEQQKKFDVVSFDKARTRNIAQGQEEGRKDERKRVREIRELFVHPNFQAREFNDLMDTAIDKGLTVEQTRDAMFEMVGRGIVPIVKPEQQAEGSAYGKLDIGDRKSPVQLVTAGADEKDRLREGMESAIMIRAGIITDRKEIEAAGTNEFLGMSAVEMAREHLRRSGVDTRNMSNRDKIVAQALSRAGGHGTSDFANLLENVAGKALLIGYEAAPETWSRWCRIGTLPDFRQGSRVALSAFSDLEIVYENGEYKYGNVTDLKEPLTLQTYGKLFKISRQALVNDDLSALGAIPNSMGRAAARTIGDAAYTVLINGITTTLNQDSTAVFHADHANFVASGSGAAPSVATVDAGRVAMAKQTDPSGVATLNIEPSFLIVPKALEGTGKVLQNAQYDPAGSAGTLTPNTVAGTFETVADARLDADSATEWYMAANPNMADTVEVAFLDGQQAPYMESQDGWNSDGVEYKVRVDFVAVPLDFRGLYKNHGS